MHKLNLDEIDRKILFELDRNSRTPISLLSKKLKLGRDRLSYRMRSLKEKGLLKRCTVTVDPYRFGLCVYKTYLQLESDKARRADLLHVFQSRPDIYWFGETDGSWDMMFGVYARSPYEFNLVQDSILDEFKDVVRGFCVYTLIEAWFFRKNYLLEMGSSFFKIGGKPEYLELDERDSEILSLLADDARMSVSEIGERISASSTLVNSRIERMEKLGIIVGYRIELDLAQLGMSSFKARLFVTEHDKDSIERLIDYARLNPYLMYMIRQIGDCKVELELEVRDFEHYTMMIDDLREKFPRLIRHVETVAIKRQTYKWMPLRRAINS